MSISSTGLHGSATIVSSDLWHASSSSHTARATIVNSDLFNDVEALKEQVTTLSRKINDLSDNRIKDIEDDIPDISNNRIKDIEDDITDMSNNRI